MTIVYCIGSLAKPGGAERVLVNKANYFTDTFGYSVHILIASQRNEPLFYTISTGVIIHNMNIERYLDKKNIPLLSFYKNIKRLKKVYEKALIQIQPSIIFVLDRGYDDFIIPVILPNVPKVRESHSSAEAVQIMDNSPTIGITRFKKSIFTYLYKMQMKKYDHVVVLTERDKVYRSYLNKKTVIPNIVASSNEKLATLTNKKVISVGRLDKFKNFKDQIVIWNEISKKHPDWTLHIYGEGSEKSNLQRLIESYHLEEKVLLHGYAQQIDKVYSGAAIFVFTSLAEGFGLVLLEAMQAGVPAVSYKTPCGPEDIITNGVDGFLVEMNDLQTFKNRIFELIENEEKRKKMGKKAHEKSNYFAPDVIMKKWDQLIQSLINE